MSGFESVCRRVEAAKKNGEIDTGLAPDIVDVATASITDVEVDEQFNYSCYRRRDMRPQQIRQKLYDYLAAFDDATFEDALITCLKEELSVVTWDGLEDGTPANHEKNTCVHPSYFVERRDTVFRDLLIGRLDELSDVVTRALNDDIAVTENGVRYDRNLAGVARLALLNEEERVTERLSSVARGLYEAGILLTTSRRRIRRVINYFDPSAVASVLYDGNDPSFFNESTGEIPVEQVYKDGDHGRLYALGGDEVGEHIVRELSGENLAAWMNAYQSSTWAELGFDYTPVEPIEEAEESYHVYTSKAAAINIESSYIVESDDIVWSDTHQYYVVTRVLGPSLGEIFEKGWGESLPRSFTKKERFEEIRGVLRKGLRQAGVRHGHLHWGNICLHPESSDEVLRVYVIDFDMAQRTTTHRLNRWFTSLRTWF